MVWLRGVVSVLLLVLLGWPRGRVLHPSWFTRILVVMRLVLSRGHIVTSMLWRGRHVWGTVRMVLVRWRRRLMLHMMLMRWWRSTVIATAWRA